jgi:hypothetical protein
MLAFHSDSRVFIAVADGALPEHRGLGRRLLAAVSQQLGAAGLKLSVGTIVNASITEHLAGFKSKNARVIRSAPHDRRSVCCRAVRFDNASLVW